MVLPTFSEDLFDLFCPPSLLKGFKSCFPHSAELKGGAVLPHVGLVLVAGGLAGAALVCSGSASLHRESSLLHGRGFAGRR